MELTCILTCRLFQMQTAYHDEEHAINNEVCEMMELLTTHKFEMADRIKQIDELVQQSRVEAQQCLFVM